jgi:hypothetical protein
VRNGGSQRFGVTKLNGWLLVFYIMANGVFRDKCMYIHRGLFRLDQRKKVYESSSEEEWFGDLLLLVSNDRTSLE